MANKGYSQYGGNPYAAGGNYDGYGAQISQEPSGISSNYAQGATPYQTESTYSAQPSGGYGTSQGYGNTSQQTSAAGGYGQSNPYGTSAPSQAYGSSTGRTQATPSQLEQGQSAPATASGGYGAPPTNAPLLSNQDFLSKVEGTRTDIRTLTSHVAEVGSLHQSSLSNTSAAPSSQLEHLISQTSILNTRIKDQIKNLERDALKDEKRNGKKNTTKESQVKTLKSNFESQLKDYNQEEATYKQRYRDQIARQYRIVNPEATDSEVQEATQADWNNEGVFQTALKTNRTGAASSVLGAVRARHNDIQRIEQTIQELSQLFIDLAKEVEVQEEPLQKVDEGMDKTRIHQENANKQLDSGIKHARNVKKMKWWCLGIAVLIVVILGLVLGLYFGLHKNNNNNK